MTDPVKKMAWFFFGGESIASAKAGEGRFPVVTPLCGTVRNKSSSEHKVSLRRTGLCLE